MHLLQLFLSLCFCCCATGALSLPYLEAEKIISLQVFACSKSTNPTQNQSDKKLPYAKLPNQSDLHWCLEMKTNKDQKEYRRMRDNVTMTQFTTQVTVKWWPFGNRQHPCAIGFRGHNSPYRLSPDFGYYTTCTQDTLRYRHELAEGPLPSPFRSIFGGSCPLKTLPQTQREYITCTLKEGVWYEFEFDSAIFAEQADGHNYVHSWTNHSEHRLFRPAAITVTSDVDGINNIVTTKTRYYGCQARVLVVQSEHWTHPLSLQLHKRVQKSISDPVSVSPVLMHGHLSSEKPWTYFDFRIEKRNTTLRQEFCLNLTSDNVPLTTSDFYCIDVQSETCAAFKFGHSYYLVILLCISLVY